MESKIDHHLIHFHNKFVSQEGLNGVTLDLEKVRRRFRQENGLPKYVAFKRAFALTNQALVDNFKEMANGAGLVLERKLLHLTRKLYNDLTPAKTWKRLLCRQPTDILVNKVYSNTAV